MDCSEDEQAAAANWVRSILESSMVNGVEGCIVSDFRTWDDLGDGNMILNDATLKIDMLPAGHAGDIMKSVAFIIHAVTTPQVVITLGEKQFAFNVCLQTTYVPGG